MTGNFFLNNNEQVPKVSSNYIKTTFDIKFSEKFDIDFSRKAIFNKDSKRLVNSNSPFNVNFKHNYDFRWKRNKRCLLFPKLELEDFDTSYKYRYP